MHFRTRVILWNVDSESNGKSLPLIIKTAMLNPLSIEEFSRMVTAIVGQRISVVVSSPCFQEGLIWAHFQICNMVDTLFPSDQLGVLIDDDVLVLEDPLAGYKWLD